MADKKNKVIVYKDWISTFDKLSDDEAGKLIKHFFQYINDLNPESDDRLITLLFEPIKQTLKRDLKAYEARCDKNKESVEKRWNESNTNVTDKVQPNTNEYKRIQPNTKHTDNDNDSDNDNDTSKEGVITPPHPLVKWLATNCKEVSKMKKPLTNDEATKLVEEFTKEEIKETFMNMENYKPLQTKSISAYLTCKKWITKDRKEKGGKIPTGNSMWAITQ